MNPTTKMILATVILIAALAFFFLGPGLIDVSEAPLEEPTPTSYMRQVIA